MKYYKAEDVINAIEGKIAEYIPTLYGRYAEIPLELRMAIEHLPTIEVSEDCISREWLISFIDAGHLRNPNEKCYSENDVVELIKNAPSVTTEQSSMVGEWVEVVKRTEQYDREGVKSWAVIYQCPYCGFILNAIENHTAQYNYCPNCGAKMKG